jgi:epoxyqueuosine reductase QueG
MASCASGFMDKSEKQIVTIEGIDFSYSMRLDFSYSMRRNYERCMYVCGGLTGLHASGKWSTWSPGRFPIPEADEDFEPAFQKALEPYSKWPRIEGGHYHFLIDAKVRTTCAHCQFICCPDKTERKKRYEMLTRSGVVVQRSNGTLEAVSPQEAIEILSHMPDETRRLYEDIE